MLKHILSAFLFIHWNIKPGQAIHVRYIVALSADGSQGYKG